MPCCEEESAEADHLHAAATLLTHQKRRAMIVWITDLADLAITPEVVTAALQAGKRHFVVVAVLGQPDVLRLTESAPADSQQTFLYAAASETLRRRELMLARLRSRGVHAIEVNAPQLTGAVLNKYLEVKQKNLTLAPALADRTPTPAAPQTTPHPAQTSARD